MYRTHLTTITQFSETQVSVYNLILSNTLISILIRTITVVSRRPLFYWVYSLSDTMSRR